MPKWDGCPDMTLPALMESQAPRSLGHQEKNWCSMKTNDFYSSLAKVDDVMDLVPHLMTPRSVGILLASALCGPPLPKTSNPPNKLCDVLT